MKFHKDGSQPRSDEVFVFGSNLAGVHGAGAAKQAVKYGARYGHGIGLQGLTYAIPTKDHDIKTLAIDKIVPYIDRFKKMTLEYPQAKFFITRVGCGLAGYKDADIAPLFKGCGENCSFPTEWERYLTM
jgi:hypothetical protein